MIYVRVDESGRIAESFNDETVNQIPIDCFKLDADQWNNRFNLRLVDGKWVDDPLTPTEVAEVPND